MTHMREVSIFALLCFVTVTAAGAPTIEPLRESEVEYGCSCSFQLPKKDPNSDGTFLQWTDGERASMRVDGKLEKLRVSQGVSKVKRQGKATVGDVDTYILENENVKVKLQCTASQVCSPSDDECESTGYRADIKVASKNGTANIKVTGACGC